MGNSTEKQRVKLLSTNLQEQEKPVKPIERLVDIKRIKNDKNFELRSANSLTQTDKMVLECELRQVEKQMVPILKNLFTDNFKKTRLSAYCPILQKVDRFKSMHNSCCGTRIFKFQNIKKAYKCYDCQIHKDSVLCHQCFFDGDHRGHRYVDVQVDGICDCGNSEIIKEQGFCSNHNLKRYAMEENKSQSDSIKYAQFVKIIVKWVFKIYQCNYTIYAEFLLNELIYYLLEINSNNHSFLLENLTIFFREFDGENLCLADHFVELYCKYSKSYRQTVIRETNLFEFFTKFFKDRLLGAQIFHIYCKAYSRNQYFCKSQLFNHLKHLASSKDICEIVISKRNTVEPFLRYKNSKNLFVYYEQLNEILEAMPSEIAQEFIKPFLQTHIPFPYMQKFYEKHFDKICQTQHLYLNLQIKIISLISDKRQLYRLIKEYMQMSKKCKDCQPGLQIPHKVIALILLRYSENNLNNFNHSARQFRRQYKNFFFKMLQKSFQNLRKFCYMLAYKNRLRFNWGYEQYYKKNHAIYYDMLIIQAVVRILPERATEIENIILKFIQNSQQSLIKKKFQQNKVSLALYMLSIRHLKINLLKMLAEIIYSRIPQLYFGARLKQYKAIKDMTEETLQSMFNTLEEIKESSFKSIKQLVFGGYLPVETVQKIATFNNKTKMYRARQQRGEKINFNIFISLAETQIYYLYNNYICHPQIQRQFILTKAFDCFSQQNRNIFQSIFSNKIVEYAFQKITNIIDDQNSFHKINEQFKMAIKLNKTLSNLYYNKDLMNQNFTLIKKAMFELASLTKEINTHHYYLENYYLIKEAQTVLQKKEEKKKEDLQKLKERQRQKREALMRVKKMKENQQLLAAKEEAIQEQTEDQNICVICKQKGKLCYLSKISFSSLMFHYFTMNGQHVTLDTCQHTIHYNCFIECHQQSNIGRCPLCRQAFNTVIPIDFQDSFQLDRCWTYYEYLLESIRTSKVNLLEECLLYLYHQKKMLAYFKLKANAQDLIKNKFIMALAKHMQTKFGYTEDQEEYIESDIIFRKQFQSFKQKILGIQAIAGEQKYIKQALPNLGLTQQYNDDDPNIIHEDKSSLKSQIQPEQALLIKQKCQGCLLNIPSSIEDYLYFRDEYLLSKQKCEQPMLCLICNIHKAKIDDQCLPSLFLNIKNATIQYRPNRNFKTTFDIYQDKDGEPWSIKKKVQGFTLNKTRLETIFRAFINNNKQTLEKMK